MAGDNLKWDEPYGVIVAHGQPVGYEQNGRQFNLKGVPFDEIIPEEPPPENPSILDRIRGR